MPGNAGNGVRGGERRQREGEGGTGRGRGGGLPSDVKESERVSGAAQDSGTLFKLRRVETSITVVPPQLSPRGQTQATYPSPSNHFFLLLYLPHLLLLSFCSAKRQDFFSPDCYTLKICFIRIAEIFEILFIARLGISVITRLSFIACISVWECALFNFICKLYIRIDSLYLSRIRCCIFIFGYK